MNLIVNELMMKSYVSIGSLYLAGLNQIRRGFLALSDILVGHLGLPEINSKHRDEGLALFAYYKPHM